MQRSFSLLALALLGPALQEPAGEGLPFEGAFVVEAPVAADGLAPGDVLISIQGRPCTTLALLRRQLAETLGSTVKARVRRQERELEIEWTPATGTYRLTDWPTPFELFRRSHARDLEKPGVQAGLAAIRAALDGKSRTAVRQLERAAEAGLQDPLLDWAEATVKIRQQNLPAEGRAPLERAFKALEKPAGAEGRRILGLCRIVASYREFMHERKHESAMKEWTAARSLGVDTSELARDLGAVLPQDSREAWTLRVQFFEDDPLDRPLAEWLAARAPTEEANVRYSEWVRRLSGVKESDPRLELSGRIAKLEADPGSRGDLQKFLAGATKLSADDRARGIDALAASFERGGERARGFDLRLESLALSPTLARARSASAAARRTGRFAPVLRFLRSMDDPKTNETSKKAYLALYGSLLTEALFREGIPSLREGARLARLGRADEAASFLIARSGELAQPELQIAAGLILRDAGSAVDFDAHFKPEMEFLSGRRWEGSSDALRAMQLMIRTEPARDSWLEDSLNRLLKGVSPDITSALRASLAWHAKQPERAVVLLRQSARELERPDAGRGWIPIFAEGRVCVSSRDYVEALNQRHGAGLQLPARAAPLSPGPAAVGASVDELRPLKKIIEESEHIVLGVLEGTDAANRTFRLKSVKTLKGTDRGVVEVNAGTAQDWHANAIMGRASPDLLAVGFFRKDSGTLLYLDRFFVRMQADPGPGWAVSRIERSMNRTFDGAASELAGLVEDALAGRREPPPPREGLTPLRGESFGVSISEGAETRVFVPDGEGFIRHWLILQPLPLDGRAGNPAEAAQKEFFDKEWFPGQNRVRPFAGDSPLPMRPDLQWEERETDDYFVDLGETLNSLSMGGVYLHSAKEIPDAVLSIGSDDSSRWQLNGEEVLRVYAGRGVGKDQDRSKPVTLKAGVNFVMFSVINGVGPSGAALRIVGPDGKPVQGLTYTLSP